jgi:hypothetical protein
MKINKITLIMLLLVSTSIFSQENYQPDIYIPEVGFLGLTEINLNDTLHIKITQKKSVVIIFSEYMGKSYFEYYHNGLVQSKGYFENSLDTLKMYHKSYDVLTKTDQISILKYFQPLKHGEWYERINGRLVRRVYKMGIFVSE